MKLNFGISGSTLAFAGFAGLIAARDVWWDLSLSKTESPAAFAFLICATISGLALMNIALRGALRQLLAKLQRPELLWKVMILGGMTGALYGLGFFLVARMGAGLFNLVDYGVTPFATVIIGWLVFGSKKENISWPDIALALIVYVIGVFLITNGMDMNGFAWVGIALLIPFITGSSDGLTKWLMSEDGGNLSRSELLFVRFVPAAAVLAVYAVVVNGRLTINAPVEAGFAAVICGFVPLWLLCTGLGRAGLQKLASWEFVIPGLAFFGTLHARTNQEGLTIAIIGAILVLSGMVINELKLGTKLVGLKNLFAPESTGYDGVKIPA